MSSRLHYLDALRSFAILYGVLVHALTLSDPPGLGLVTEASGFFRMAAFFAVSGFFAALLLDRMGPRAFLARRTVALGVPLLVGLALLNPVANWLVFAWHNGWVGFGAWLADPDGSAAGGPRGPGVWHLHLWFLFSLLAYMPLALLAAPALGGARAGRLAGRLARMRPDLALLLLAGGVATACVLARILARMDNALLAGTPVNWLVQATLYYAPFFLVGVALHRQPLLARVVERLSLPVLALGLLAVWAAPRLPAGLPGAALDGATVWSRAFLTMGLVAGLLWIFRRFFSAPSVLSRQADAVCSVYVLHYLVVYALAHLLGPLAPDPTLHVALVSGAGIAVLLLVHRHVIAPSAVLRFLLNGRPLAAPAPALRPGLAGS